MALNFFSLKIEPLIQSFCESHCRSISCLTIKAMEGFNKPTWQSCCHHFPWEWRNALSYHLRVYLYVMDQAVNIISQYALSYIFLENNHTSMWFVHLMFMLAEFSWKILFHPVYKQQTRYSRPKKPPVKKNISALLVDYLDVHDCVSVCVSVCMHSFLRGGRGEGGSVWIKLGHRAQAPACSPVPTQSLFLSLSWLSSSTPPWTSVLKQP